MQRDQIIRDITHQPEKIILNSLDKWATEKFSVED